ncbi:hypothetical protein QJQ45_020074 [Haematococcus lacustris]|nr:hypothetical protein QJQ45_020074 [Haematococcus lacustris]
MTGQFTRGLPPAITNDLFDLPRDQLASLPPPAFSPFRFEVKRARIDWRLLHGVDLNAIIRDVDLDTLERIVGIIAFGDIDAEDTRQLTEMNFLKVFKLSQLILEYLLYVQDCLQSTNTWMQQDRQQLEKYIAAARIRLRELDSGYRMSKRELRRARKTVKTYELMTALGKMPGQHDTSGLSGKAGAARMAGEEHADVTRSDTAPARSAQPDTTSAMAAAMEAVLRRELEVLHDRLGRAQAEAQALQAERAEMLTHLKDVDGALRKQAASLQTKSSADMAELRNLKDQLARAQTDNRMLRAEKEEVAQELSKAVAARRVLQSERDQMLQELTSQSAAQVSRAESGLGPGMPTPTPPGPQGADSGRLAASPPSPSPLGPLLLAAEERNRLQAQELEQLQGQVAALQKQLMKAMKEAANMAKPSPPLPPPPPPPPPPPSNNGQAVEELQRALATSEAARGDLAARVTTLEVELAHKRRQHHQDVEELQEELVSYQEQASALRSELLALKAKGSTTSALAVKPKSGFVRDSEQTDPAPQQPPKPSPREAEVRGPGQQSVLASLLACLPLALPTIPAYTAAITTPSTKHCSLPPALHHCRTCSCFGNDKPLLIWQDQLYITGSFPLSACLWPMSLEVVTAERDGLAVQVQELQRQLQQLQDTLRLRGGQLDSALLQIKQLQAQLDGSAPAPEHPALGRVKQQLAGECWAQALRLLAMWWSLSVQPSWPPLPPPPATLTPAPAPPPPLPAPPRSEITAAVGAPSSAAGHLPSHQLALDTTNNGSFRFQQPGPGGARQEHASASGSNSPATPALPGPRNTGGHLAGDRAAGPAAAPAQQVVQPLQHRPVRPSASEMQATKQRIMSRVAGLTVEELSQLLEKDLRAETDHPYDFEEDDEEQFRAALPHEVPGTRHGGVRALQPHTLQDLVYAQQRHGPALMGSLDDALAAFGIDPEQRTLRDREYAGVMLELKERREASLAHLSEEQQGRAEFLRDALLTHIELVKRAATGRAHLQVVTSGVSDGGEAAAIMKLLAEADPAETYAAMARRNGQQRAMDSSSPGPNITLSRPHSSALPPAPGNAAPPPGDAKAGTQPADPHFQELAQNLPSTRGWATGAASQKVPTLQQPHAGGSQGADPRMQHTASSSVLPGPSSSLPASQPDSPNSSTKLRDGAGTNYNQSLRAMLSRQLLQQQQQQQQQSQGDVAASSNHSQSSLAAAALPTAPPQETASGMTSSSRGVGNTATAPDVGPGPSTSVRPGPPPLPANVSALNMSQSNNMSMTGKASLRDYSAHDFDDQDSGSDSSQELERLQSDEYAVGPDDEEEVDEGLSVELPAPAFSRPAPLQRPGTSPSAQAPAMNRTIERPSTGQPSRLARVTAAEPPGPQAAGAAVAAGRAAFAAPAAAQPGASGSWLQRTEQESEDSDGNEDDPTMEVDHASIHSFNNTATSSQRPTGPQRIGVPGRATASAVAGAWGSPASTFSAPARAASGNPLPGGSGLQRPSGGVEAAGEAGGGRWSDAVQAVGSGDDEVEAFNMSANNSIRGVGPQPRSAPAGPLAVAASQDLARSQLARNDSFDSVSEIEYA